MSSRGTGADISAQEAIDLLHKLITESTKLQAVFWGRGGVSITLTGTASTPQPGNVMVSERRSPSDAALVFGLADVKTFKYGDSRAFPGRSVIPGTPRLESALIFMYPDDTSVTLFEIAV